VAGEEGAPLVEHAFVGQLLLAVGGFDHAIAQHAGGVVAARALGGPLGVAHHQNHALQMGAGLHELLQRLVARAHEGGAQVQVFRRISTQRQFRREQHACALGIGLLGSGQYFLRVPRQVAHDVIELCGANRE